MKKISTFVFLMTLEIYITDLLYRYDCVIVPNFGGFVANTKPAKITNNTFSPPFKQLTFNTLLQNNDGLLANYIAQVDKMPYETAVNFIAFKVQEWVDKLLDEELDLEGLGTLFLANDKIQFEPENKVNYLTSSYGLSDFTASNISRKIVVEDENSTETTEIIPVLENKREVYKEQVETLEEKSPIYISSEKRRKTPLFVKYAAVFLLSASVLGIANKMYTEDSKDQKQLVTFKKQQQLRNAKIQTATFVIESPLPAIVLNTVSINVNKEIYHIISGAFRSEANATKKVNQLIAQGFSAKIVGKNKYNLYQVAFASFSNLDKANKELSTIKDEIAKDAWLLVTE